MKVVFWGSCAGKASVTASAIAVACAASLKFGVRTSLCSLKYDNREFTVPFVNNKGTVLLESVGNSGIDTLLRNVEMDTDDSELIKSSAISFFNRNLNVYLPTRMQSEKSYKHQLVPALPKIFYSLDNAFELSIVDCFSGFSADSASVLEEADLVVVCMNQSIAEIEKLFKQCTFTNPNKYFFLFGNYDMHSVCSMKTFCREHKSIASVRNVGAIMHSAQFIDSMNNSSVVKFFYQNVACKPNDPNYVFFSELYDTTERLLHLGGIRILKGVV